MEQISRRGFFGFIGKLAAVAVASKIPILSSIAAPVARKFDYGRFAEITRLHIIPAINDNIFKSNSLWHHLKNHHEPPLSGGEEIRAPFVFDNEDDPA